MLEFASSDSACSSSKVELVCSLENLSLGHLSLAVMEDSLLVCLSLHRPIHKMKV